MKWAIPNFDTHLVESLSRDLNIPHLVAQLLVNRGLQTPLEANHFLSPDLSMLHDPFLFRDMERTVQRILQAIANQETILIHGDYDADGICGTAILTLILKKYSANVLQYIPHRLNQGYGFKSEAIQWATEHGVRLVITVDCGITSVKEVLEANSKGMDVIITDHHTFPDSLPKAYSILHPSLPEERYPYQHLSGTGVAFKLAQGLMNTKPLENNSIFLNELLELACIGTLSDIVMMNGENRVIVKHGLERLAITNNPGLKSLMEMTHLYNKKLSSWHILFVIGPRINAAGRMGDADLALELLLTDSLSKAREIALQLDQYNQDRQAIEKEILEQAEQLVNCQINLDKESVIVLANPGWHIGVLGIVASKLVEKYAKPVILLTVAEGKAKGSGRSMEGFPITQALKYCDDLLLNYGGHEMACGISLSADNIIRFRDKINVFADFPEYAIAEKRIPLDGEIHFQDLNLDILKSLDKLEPYGPGNHEPVFAIQELQTQGIPRIIKNSHLKLHITDGTFHGEAIWFGQADKAPMFRNNPGPWKIIGHPHINSFNGIDTIQIRIIDIS